MLRCVALICPFLCSPRNRTPISPPPSHPHYIASPPHPGVHFQTPLPSPSAQSLKMLPLFSTAFSNVVPLLPSINAHPLHQTTCSPHSTSPARFSRSSFRFRFRFRLHPVCNSDKSDPPDEGEPHEIPQSAIEWNSEWAKFRESGMRSFAPEGRQPLTAQQRARRNVQKKIRNATDMMPSRQQLFADWRFWLALILSLSLFSAFVQSTTTGSGYA